MGYSPQGHKESDTTEQLTLSLHFPNNSHSLSQTARFGGSNGNGGDDMCVCIYGEGKCGNLPFYE